MKAKVFYISFLLLCFTAHASAQSKPAKVVQDMKARKEKREKQVALLHAQVSEQKAQLQFEKKPDISSASLPGNSNGSQQGNVNTSPAATEKSKEPAGKTGGG
jgi:hypothetical protein